MNLRTLEMFQAVAETQSISKAAEQLHTVQSNITTRIKQLESMLHTKLFYRQQRGMKLTSNGVIYKEYIDEMLQIYSQANLALQGDEAKGKIKIGSMETTAAIHLPKYLSKYYNQYPQVDIQLITNHSKALTQAIIDYKLDIAFIGGKVDNHELEMISAFDEKLVLITSKAIKNLNQLKHPNMICFHQGCSYRVQTEQWLCVQHITPKSIMEFGSLDAIIGCVAGNMGISLLPYSLVSQNHYLNQINFFPIDKLLANIKTYIIYRKNSVITTALNQFIKMMIESD